MGLEYIPVPSADYETIDEAIDNWLEKIRKLAHSLASDQVKLDNQQAEVKETIKISTPL